MWSYINVITFLTLHTFSLTWFAAVVCTQRGKMPIHKTCGIKNPYPILLVTAILLITGEVLHAWLLQRDSINWHFGKLIPRGFSRIWPQFICREVSIVALLWWLEVSNLLPDFSSQKRKRLHISRLPIIAKYRFEGRYIKWKGAGNWKEILLRGRFFTYGYGESKTCIWHF